MSGGFTMNPLTLGMILCSDLEAGRSPMVDGFTLWLSHWVCTEEEVVAYSKLLTRLNTFPFIAVMERDRDRIMDAEEQRDEFASYTNQTLSFNSGPSVLEVLVALARKLNDIIGYETSSPERWFWYMIYSLGLQSFRDDRCDNEALNDIRVILNRFVNRDYDSDGDGGCCYFPCGKDLRKVDIWYQWMWYLNSLEEFKGE